MTNVYIISLRRGGVPSPPKKYKKANTVGDDAHIVPFRFALGGNRVADLVQMAALMIGGQEKTMPRHPINDFLHCIVVAGFHPRPKNIKKQTP